MPRRLVRTLALLLGAAACRNPDALSASDSTFVVTMAELRRLPQGTTGDSTARAAVLRRRGFSQDSLERFARALAGDPQRAAAVWREIEKRAPAPLPGAVAPPPATPPPATPPPETPTPPSPKTRPAGAARQRA